MRIKSSYGGLRHDALPGIILPSVRLLRGAPASLLWGPKHALPAAVICGGNILPNACDASMTCGRRTRKAAVITLEQLLLDCEFPCA